PLLLRRPNRRELRGESLLRAVNQDEDRLSVRVAPLLEAEELLVPPSLVSAALRLPSPIILFARAPLAVSCLLLRRGFPSKSGLEILRKLRLFPAQVGPLLGERSDLLPLRDRRVSSRSCLSPVAGRRG